MVAQLPESILLDSMVTDVTKMLRTIVHMAEGLLRSQTSAKVGRKRKKEKTI